MLLQFFKPLIVLWAGLNALDDLSVLTRLIRLGAVIVPGGGGQDLCSVCDDVMGDLLKGADGLDALPCGMACLRIPACMRMCENIKNSAQNSTHFPCMAAGYCEPEDGEVDVEPECELKPFFRCAPSRYCALKRQRLHFSCQLRPGIGRWVGMRNAVGTHAAALADGLLSQPFCGEPDAGPYCIARPKGIGAICEALGHALALLYGGYRTVVSIETPGGDDDRQWLTFWLMLVVALFTERMFARVVLSTFPMYYEAKLLGVAWLVFANGAEKFYRRLRRLLIETLRLEKLFLKAKGGVSAEAAALASFQCHCAPIVEAALAEARKKKLGLGAAEPATAFSAAVSSSRDWEEVAPADAEALSAEEQHHAVCEYILSSAGSAALAAHCHDDASYRAFLLERAASHVSFQPRYLIAHVEGVAEADKGCAVAELPPMDSNGRSDAYVTCRVELPEGLSDEPLSPRRARRIARGVSTRTVYRTTRPHWGQSLEVPIEGGKIEEDGMFRLTSDATAHGTIVLQVHDADLGLWGWLLIAARLAALALAALATLSYVFGIADNLSQRQIRLGIATAAAIGAVMAVAYSAHVRFRSDDELIGVARVPLHLLCDQRAHTLLLTLRKPGGGGKSSHDVKAEGGFGGTGGGGFRTNSVGGLGVIKVRLALSER